MGWSGGGEHNQVSLWLRRGNGVQKIEEGSYPTVRGSGEVVLTVIEIWTHALVNARCTVDRTRYRVPKGGGRRGTGSYCDRARPETAVGSCWTLPPAEDDCRMWL